MFDRKKVIFVYNKVQKFSANSEIFIKSLCNLK